MSDIGFYGLEAAVVGLGMLVLTVVGLLIEAVLWRKRRRLGAASSLIFLAPLLYGAFALALLYVAEEGSLDLKRAADDASWFIAGLGLVLWGAIHGGSRRLALS